VESITPGSDRSQEAAFELLRSWLIREAVEDVERPHVVLVLDPHGTPSLVLGPFGNALAAATATETQRAEDDRELGPSASRRYLVHPIYAPSSPSRG